jgi:hypothetical protein
VILLLAHNHQCPRTVNHESEMGDSCRAVKKILAYRLTDGGDGWILPGTRIMIFKDK